MLYTMLMSLENLDEKYLSQFTFLTPNSKRLVLTITHLFDEVNEKAKKNINVIDARNKIVFSFHKSLKSYCLAKYGNEKLWMQVPEVQKLVGGSLENRPTISDEQFTDISDQVLGVIAELEVLVDSK